jgi:hypothetical protein
MYEYEAHSTDEVMQPSLRKNYKYAEVLASCLVFVRWLVKILAQTQTIITNTLHGFPQSKKLAGEQVTTVQVTNHCHLISEQYTH